MTTCAIIEKICAPLCKEALLPRSMNTCLRGVPFDAPITEEDRNILNAAKKDALFMHRYSLWYGFCLFIFTCEVKYNEKSEIYKRKSST